MTGTRQACESLALPHALTYARLYPCGWRCARHTPAAEKGQPESPPGPGWPAHRTPPPDPGDSPTERQEQQHDH